MTRGRSKRKRKESERVYRFNPYLCRRSSKKQEYFSKVNEEFADVMDMKNMGEWEIK